MERDALELDNCGFDFEQCYGADGRGLAHVHHVTPLASLDAPSRARLADLAIVCASCHAMIHWRGACRPLKDLISRDGQ